MHQSQASIFWGWSERPDGKMKIWNDGRDDGPALANRQKFFARLGLDSADAVIVVLAHGTHGAKVTSSDAGKMIPETDALMTDQKGLILTVTVADCLPIFFFDPMHQAIGLAHAGWRGVADGMAERVVASMAKSYATQPDDLLVWIGPHIQSCHFEVQSEVADKFVQYPGSIIHRAGKTFIGLQSIVKRQLMSVGVKDGNIELTSECTYCQPEKYFSYRHDKPELGSLVAYMGLKA